MNESAGEKRPGIISRRKILTGLGIGTAMVVTGEAGNKIFRWLMTPPEFQLPSKVVEKELKDDLGLGELKKKRQEFFTAWPIARFWVRVNNSWAAKTLDGLVFEKGKEYSLIELLKLKSYLNKYSPDPNTGFIPGVVVSKEPPFLSLTDSQGLSLTANCLARVLALSPVLISEWHTHTDVNEVTVNYFRPEWQVLTHPAYTHLGTDATVFVGPEKTGYDLRFSPLVDLRLRCKVMSCQGKPVLPEEFDLGDIPLGYASSLTRRFPVPVLVRFALGAESLSPYEIDLTPQVWDINNQRVPGFTRILKEDGKIIREEKVTAHYDTEGKFLAA